MATLPMRVETLNHEEAANKSLMRFFKHFDKQDIAKQRAVIVAEVEDGYVSALEMAAGIKFIEKVLLGDDKEDGVIKLIRPNIITEAHLYSKEKTFKHNGVKFTKMEAGGKYDYSADPIWCRLNEQLTELKEQMKAHEELLKTVPEAKMQPSSEFGEMTPNAPVSLMRLIDPETGEEYAPVRATKTGGTETVSITIF